MTDLFEEVNETPEAPKPDVKKLDFLDEIVNDIRGEPIQPGDITAAGFKERYGYASNQGAKYMMEAICKDRDDCKLVRVYVDGHTTWALRKVG